MFKDGTFAPLSMTKRDAQVTFSSLNPKAKVRMVLTTTALQNPRVIKGSAATSVGALCDALIGPANEGETTGIGA